MEQLWDVPGQRDQFVTLSEVALANMDASNPPLFLRFVNLLINDNIYLLDEGISCMIQLKEMLLEK